MRNLLDTPNNRQHYPALFDGSNTSVLGQKVTRMIVEGDQRPLPQLITDAIHGTKHNLSGIVTYRKKVTLPWHGCLNMESWPNPVGDGHWPSCTVAIQYYHITKGLELVQIDFESYWSPPEETEFYLSVDSKGTKLSWEIRPEGWHSAIFKYKR